MQMGLAGQPSLTQIAAAVGHARSTIQQWFGRFRKGGVERLLGDGRAENPGAEGLLTGKVRLQFEAGLGKATRRTAPPIRQWLAREHGNVRVRTLPAYSPELNPVEKLWDQIKDVLCNRAFGSIGHLQAVITTWLENFVSDARRAFDLIGRGWLLDGANASCTKIIPN